MKTIFQKQLEKVKSHYNLEHDYPDELDDALADLNDCIDYFDYMNEVVTKVFAFAERYHATS